MQVQQRTRYLPIDRLFYCKALLLGMREDRGSIEDVTPKSSLRLSFGIYSILQKGVWREANVRTEKIIYSPSGYQKRLQVFHPKKKIIIPQNKKIYETLSSQEAALKLYAQMNLGWVDYVSGKLIDFVVGQSAYFWLLLGGSTRWNAKHSLSRYWYDGKSDNIVPDFNILRYSDDAVINFLMKDETKIEAV